MEVEFEDYIIDVPDDVDDEELLDFLSNLPAFSESDRYGYLSDGDIAVGPDGLLPPKRIVDPELERSAILPVGYRDGKPELALPEFAADAAQGAYNIAGALAGRHKLSDEMLVDSAMSGMLPVAGASAAQKQAPGTLRSFMGQKAAMRDPEKRAAMRKAMQMEDAGIKREDIYDATGMFRSSNKGRKEWYWEEPNTGFLDNKQTPIDKIMQDPNWRISEAPRTMKLGDILGPDDPAVLRYGDAVKNIDVRLHYKPKSEDWKYGVKGNANRSDGLINLWFNDADEAKNAVVHELQHIIQGIEGYTSGASKKYFWSKFFAPKDLARLDRVRTLARAMGYKWDRKKDAPENIAAMRMALRKSDLPKQSADRILRDEIEHLSRIHKEAPDSFMKYWTQSGEVDARNASTRSVLDIEGSYPWETVDVKPETIHSRVRDMGASEDVRFPSDFGSIWDSKLDR